MRFSIPFIIGSFIGVFITNSLNAFHYNFHEKDTSFQPSNKSLANWLKEGHWEGHVRYFFMHTNNQKPLTDYFAHAFGMGIGLESAEFHHFKIAISGFFIHNIGSSDLAKLDTLAHASNRYEVGLFDIENPNNRHDLDRLENFSISYSKKAFSIKWGKQTIQTPFINPQDGRMRPTLVKGLTSWISIEKKNMFLYAGIITGLSPRSTIQWYSVGESIGIYPSGTNLFGHPANYHHHIQSNGLAYVGIEKKWRSSLHVQFWNQWVQNVMNTQLIEWSYPVFKHHKIPMTAFFMAIHQQKLGNGGNPNPEWTYFQNHKNPWVFSARLVVPIKHHVLRLNTTRITSHGQYLMPREWGREPFYTFISRERNEGLANSTSFSLSWLSHLSHQWNYAIHLGYYALPSSKNYHQNKYGLPSYLHLNTEWIYSPKNFWKGIEIRALIIYKKCASNTPSAKELFNKTNMINTNLIVNYYF